MDIPKFDVWEDTLDLREVHSVYIQGERYTLLSLSLSLSVRLCVCVISQVAR